MRLTKKNNGTGSWTQLGDKYLPAHNVKHKECVNKLGQLEDIEDKLGVDLITISKAFEIIKKKEVDVEMFISDCNDKDPILLRILFNADNNYELIAKRAVGEGKEKLTQEEYELLKEVLL